LLVYGVTVIVALSVMPVELSIGIDMLSDDIVPVVWFIAKADDVIAPPTKVAVAMMLNITNILNLFISFSFII